MQHSHITIRLTFSKHCGNISQFNHRPGNRPQLNLMARILIACEFSGTVRDAFIRMGHDAISCDLLDTESEGPHYKGDVFDIINDGFDLMIAHPPCTYLTVSAKEMG